MRVELAYGREGLEIDLPENVPVTVIEPRFVPGLPDEEGAILEALQSPIGAEPVRGIAGPDDTVAVVFSDLTRPMPNDRVLPPLLAELESAGVPRNQVVLINGLGTHRPQTDEELRGMLGADVVDSYRILQHDAWDEPALVAVCTNHAGRPILVNRAYVEASVRILTGFIEPHFFAGFSGGPKAVLPAIAGIEAIMDNHGAAMIAEPLATWAETHGNPLWEEMLGCAQATNPHFLLNVTLNKERHITGVFGGDLLAAYEAGTEFVRQTAMRAVEQPFDVVITSNSGYPLDLNLYQSVKGMSAAARIVRSGGDIIVAAECWDGIPDHGEYRRLLWEAESVDALLARVTQPGFRSHDQWQVQAQAQIQQKARVHVYAGGLSDEQLENALFTPCRSIERTVDTILRQNPAASIAVLPDGPQTVPFVNGSRGT
jgi:nickel-dependent lactate racemase